MFIRLSADGPKLRLFRPARRRVEKGGVDPVGLSFR